MEYIKKIEELKQKNVSKIENFKLVNRQIELNIESILKEVIKLEKEIEFIKNVDHEIKHHFFELCVSLKI